MKFMKVKYYQFFNGGIFMKVKKLLTLLLATSMLVACGTQTKSSDKSSSSEPAPSTTSSDVPSTSSSSSNTSSESSSSSSSSAPSTSSSSSAPSTSSSSSNPSTSSSAPVVVTLVSISVTAPTKLAYTTADTALDLTGMVVTANYSDATQRVITEGYTVSTVDFSTAGDKTVTVTFEGKTDSFTITVAQAKPTAWDADLTAKFQANLYGYVPPFFYSPDFGLGTLTWQEDTEDKALWATGGTLAAQKEGEDSPLKPIGDLFIADGFVASVTPSFEEEVFYYVMEKAVTSEGKQRYIEARIATLNGNDFSNGGQFYIEISDSYFYDWATSGFEAAIKGAMNFSEDIPDLPEGLRYLKRYLTIFARQAQKGYVGFEASGATVALVNEYLDALENAGWAFKRSEREDVMFDIFSPELKIRLGLDYDQTNQVMTLMFDVPPIVPDYVNYVAELYNIPGKGYVFNYSEDYDNYFYTFSEELEGGQTLGDLLDKYNAVLKADTEGAWAQKGERKTVNSGLVYETFVSEGEGIEVTLYAFNDEEDGTGVQITVEKYSSVPEQFIPAMTLLGVDPSKTHTEDGETIYHAYFESSVTLQDGIKHFTDILDGDTTLNFKVVTPLTEGTLSGSGDQCFYSIYANNNVAIEFLAYVASDGRTDVQMRFSDYTPAPESPWVDAFAEGLGIQFTWVSEDSEFVYGAKIEFKEGDTYDAIAADIANKLLAVDGDLDVLCTQKGSTYTVLTYFGAYGCIEIQAFTNDGVNHYIRIGITLFADPDADPYFNAIGALLGCQLVESTTQPGVYVGSGTNVNAGLNFKTTNYGSLVAKGYSVGKYLINSSLGFSFDQKQSGYDTNNNVYIATFTSESGWVVYLYFICNDTGIFTGDVQYFVVAPAD